MKINYIAYMQLSVAMFLAGSSVIAGKLLVTIPIFFSQMVSSLIALLIIYPIARILEGSIAKVKLNKNDILFLFLQALTGNFLFRIFLIVGLKYTNLLESGIILGTSPIVFVILSFVFLKEKINRKLVFAVCLCTFGIILLKTTNYTNSNFTSLSLIGYILIFLAVISESLFTIFRKKQSYKDKPITTTTIITFFSFILFCPPGFYQMINFHCDSLTLIHITSILYYSIFCSVAAYIFWFLGISKVTVSSAAVFTGIMPISSVFLSITLLHEKLYLQHIIGLTLTLVSVYIVNFINIKEAM
ncbi:MAG: DMT family transporter [Clostridiales bacterium]